MVADPRELQANERTLLAWLRTSASLITLGFAVSKLGEWLHDTGHRRGSLSVAELLGAVFVTLGGISSLLALVRYHKVRNAIIAGTAVPLAGAAVSVIVAIVAVVGLALGVYLFAFRTTA